MMQNVHLLDARGRGRGALLSLADGAALLDGEAAVSVKAFLAACGDDVLHPASLTGPQSRGARRAEVDVIRVRGDEQDFPVVHSRTHRRH